MHHTEPCCVFDGDFVMDANVQGISSYQVLLWRSLTIHPENSRNWIRDEFDVHGFI